MFSLMRNSAAQVTFVANKAHACDSVRILLRCFANDNRRKLRNDDKPPRERKNSIRERDRIADRRGGERESTANLKNILDKFDSTEHTVAKETSKGKLTKPLEKEIKVALSPAARGQLDSFSEDILDVLNDALDSSKLMNTFKGSPRSSKLVEFIQVRLNKDCSHVTALWSSDILNGFIKTIEKGQKDEMEQEKIYKEKQDKYNDEHQIKFESSNIDAEVLYNRGVKYINR